MTTWYVHRNGGPGTPISMAGQHEQPGYADEALDDASDREILAYLAVATAIAPIAPSPRAWLERLSPTTETAIFDAARGNTAILQWLFKAAGNPTIDVTAPETITGVAALVAVGLITTAEQTALLAP